ncbi:flagellar biosynthesis protein FlhB [Crenobacter cavernae]|uniref:Flagellar biosynthetic protein FlhB n=1 Tax=Crenobacter cavernae TaxID=2290923 RepID=A0A345Y2J4_9NEIS|nr:flagellar biosynthesis protein FlhB [Crenobacter cavernae]AXK38146.1 flagellar type III secretion system protein FlhB [Crenobacter cavernae]
MAAEDSDLERTEPASERRLQQAREEGNVPRSRELATFAVTMTGVAMLMAQGPALATFLMEVIRRLYTFDMATLKTNDVIMTRFRDAFLDTLMALLPTLGALALVAAITPLMIGGWNLTFKNIQPKFSKLNPASGIKRMFSVAAAGEGLKAILKSVLIGGVATWVIWTDRMEIVGLVSLPLEVGIVRLGELLIHTFLIVVGAMLLLVVVDVPLQLWQYHKRLRMTKEEVRQEYKEQEGSPEVKGRIRQLQREAARKRMMSEIPKANVIVTNPTHYAVAIKYEEGMRAPQVVAKGALKLAERIIETGREHRVTLMRVPSFTRAIYFNADIGEEIPGKLFEAAAQVLAYVYQLKAYEINGGLAPVFPDALDVPPELDPQSKRPQATAPR